MEKIIAGVKVVETNWGIANRFSDCIEINKHLKDYPKLYKPILAHELGHETTDFTLDDLKYDLVSSNKVSQWGVLKFMFHHPKAILQFFPIYWTKKRGFVYDINLSIFYLFVLSILGITIFLGVKFI